MKTKNIHMKFGFVLLIPLFVLAVGVTNSFSDLIDEEEAIAVADLWYAMELNSGFVQIAKEQTKARLDTVQNRVVRYLVSKDDLLDTPPADQAVLAYVITYDPSGYVVVSGDDRLDAVVVFDATAAFRWDEPEVNFLRYFLGTEMVASVDCINEEVNKGGHVDTHPNWTELREQVQEGIHLNDARFEDIEVSPEAVYVLHPTALWNQCGFYNDTVSAHNNNNACIPTGCVATAMAIKTRFHAWPATGTGGVHSYTDNEGTITGSHSVNFNNETYNWAAMPTTDLTSANVDVADLMYQCGVSVDMNYELGCCGTGTGSGADTLEIGIALVDHLRYKGCTRVNSNTISDHEGNVRKSILGWLPANLGGHGHSVVADGYRDTQSPYYHINAGWSGQCNGWYNLSNVVNSSLGCTGAAITKSVSYCSPNNYIFVDGSWGGSENGNIQSPFDTMSEGVSAVPSYGHLWVKAGNYSGSGDVPITINTAMTIKSYEGTAIIGGP